VAAVTIVGLAIKLMIGTWSILISSSEMRAENRIRFSSSRS